MSFTWNALRKRKIHAKTVAYGLTANSPITQVIPRRGRMITKAFRSVLYAGGMSQWQGEGASGFHVARVPCSIQRVGTRVQNRCTLGKKKHTEEESTSKLKHYCNQQPTYMYVCMYVCMYTWIVNHRGAATRCVMQTFDHVCCCTVCITAFTNNVACIGLPTHKPASLLVNFSFARSNWPFLNWYTLLRVIPTNTQFTCTQCEIYINTAPDYSATPESGERA